NPFESGTVQANYGFVVASQPLSPQLALRYQTHRMFSSSITTNPYLGNPDDENLHRYPLFCPVKEDEVIVRDKALPMDVSKRVFCGRNVPWLGSFQGPRLLQSLWFQINPKTIPLHPMVNLIPAHQLGVTNAAMTLAVNCLGPVINFFRPGGKHKDSGSVFFTLLSSILIQSKFYTTSVGGQFLLSYDAFFEEDMTAPRCMSSAMGDIGLMFQDCTPCESPSGNVFLSNGRSEPPTGKEMTFLCRGTKRFMVFKEERRNKVMSYTEDIGDLCIFLGNSEPFCVKASSFPGLNLTPSILQEMALENHVPSVPSLRRPSLQHHSPFTGSLQCLSRLLTKEETSSLRTLLRAGQAILRPLLLSLSSKPSLRKLALHASHRDANPSDVLLLLRQTLLVVSCHLLWWKRSPGVMTQLHTFDPAKDEHIIVGDKPFPQELVGSFSGGKFPWMGSFFYGANWRGNVLFSSREEDYLVAVKFTGRPVSIYKPSDTKAVHLTLPHNVSIILNHPFDCKIPERGQRVLGWSGQGVPEVANTLVVLGTGSMNPTTLSSMCAVHTFLKLLVIRAHDLVESFIKTTI
ncbi:LOW QUALITY PROTEIN: hypothetical protein HID58_052476, partial [Brassica napus]